MKTRSFILPNAITAALWLVMAGLVSSSETAGEKPSREDREAEQWKQELDERSRWWSMQPPVREIPPEVDGRWNREPVDRFIRSRLNEEGIAPAEPASAEILIRRLSFVLTGLPPKPEEVQAFREAWNRDREDSLSQLVDNLLASPHFGERFARHWMDVVRYTDTYGYEWDIPAKGSWEYRDYLTRAFNQDIGFDQLIREQIAGDLLADPRIGLESGLNESLIGPMFYHMGEHRHGNSMQFNGIHQEMIDNKIDAFSKAFLGMTVACARCHDHKLDAISQRDYYALAGVFMTPRWTSRTIDAPGKHDSQISELKRLRGEIHDTLAKQWLREIENGALDCETLKRWAAAKTPPTDSIGYPVASLANEITWMEDIPVSAEAENPATTLAIESDGRTVLASGLPLPQTDSYTVRFSSPPGNVGALRLEALVHESLGQKGPGRTTHGNFVLSHIRVEVRDRKENKTRSLPLTAATADYEQPNYPVLESLRDTPGGWGVGLGGNVNRTALFYFAEPVSLPEGGDWTVALHFKLGGGHILGRFRLSPGRVASVDPNDSDLVLKKWDDLSRAWKRTRDERSRKNESFTVLSDFSEPGFPEGWVTEGDGIKHGYVKEATPLVSLEGETVISGLLQRGYHTHALSSKLPGAVRAPDPDTLPGKKGRVKITGGEWAGRSAVPENAFLNEGPLFFDPARPPQWTPIDSPEQLTNGVTRVLTEFATASLHPNFPPRTGVARSGSTVLPNKDQGFDKRSWFSIVGIVADETGGAPVETLDSFAGLYEGNRPQSREEIEERLENWLSDVVVRFAKGKSARGDGEILNWLVAEKLLPNSLDSSPELSALVAKYRQVESTISFPRSANSMDERAVEPVNYRLNLRGDVYSEGPEIERNFLEVFSGQHDVSTSSGSGRLELAHYLSSNDNPQTARVFVNRIWQWIFGTGLVATPSDFGKLGDRPSHPELLDWLALQFVDEGWSTKKLVRRLVLSETFLQSGEVSSAGRERDPSNRLLHHYPTRRLEAEAIRDSLLAVSGELDPQLYGRPIDPWRRAEDEKKRLFSGPLDGNGRRSLYLEMSIMQPSEFLVGFNLPDLKLPTGKRDVTNVPAQALILLNDPLVEHLANKWGTRLAESEPRSIEARVTRMFLTAFSREPNGEEIRRWSEAVVAFAESDDVLRDSTAWSTLAHTLFNTKEFLYYR